jgi:SAM-dependent methyltransferase
MVLPSKRAALLLKAADSAIKGPDSCIAQMAGSRIAAMWLANRLFPSVRRLQARLASAEAQLAMVDVRSQYKQVWNGLSHEPRKARYAILGTADETEFLGSAAVSAAEIQETVCISSDDIALEIGCGIGRVGKALAPFCREWIGCDVSANMLGLARDNLAGLANIKLVEVSGFDLAPVPDMTVDVVYCHVVFMHLWPFDRYNYVLEAKRVLRPGGRVFIDNIDLLTEEGWRVFEKDRTGYAPLKRPPHVSLISTPDELTTYLSRAGFESIRTRNIRFWVQAWATKPV